MSTSSPASPESPNPGFRLEDSAPRLTNLLRRALRRRGRLAFVDGAAWGFLVGVIGASLFKLYEKLVNPNWDSATSWTIVAVSVVAPIAIGALTAWLFRPRDAFRAALAIEGEYALKERLSSIVFLQKNAHQFDPEAASALIKDGDEYATRVDLRRAIPFRRPRASIAAGVMALVFTGLVFLPQYDVLGAEEEREQIAQEEKRVDEARKRQQKRIAKLQEEAKKKKVDPRTQKLLQKMAKRPEEAKRSKDRKSAQGQPKRRELADMEKLRREAKELRNRADMKSLDNFLNKVQSAGRKMQSQEGKQLAKSLNKGDLSGASEAMKKLAKKMEELKKKGDPASKKELDKLADDMKSLADKMSKATPSMAKLTEKLADLDNMSAAELSKMLSDASSSMSELERLAREKDILDQALQDIELTEEELASLPAEYPEPCEICKAGGT